MMKIYYWLLLNLIFVHRSFEKHFRGGSISWKQVFSNEILAIVNAKISLSFAQIDANNKTFFYCNKTTIEKKERLGYINDAAKKMLGQVHINNKSGSFQLKDFDGLYCHDFSKSENWMFGEKIIPIIYYFPKIPPYQFNITYRGSEWIENLNEAKTWNLTSRVNLEKNKTNQSPIATMFPITRIPIGCRTELKIPIHSNGNKQVKCRWAKDKECNYNCKQPENVTLNEANCSVLFNLKNKVGLYVIRIQVEDLASKISIPLEFLVEAFSNTFILKKNCTIDKPLFTTSTRENNACVSIKKSTNYKETISVHDENYMVNEIKTKSPYGFIKSGLFQCVNSSTVNVNLSWVTPNETGMDFLCFQALTRMNISSEQRCIALAIGFEPPFLLQNTIFPKGSIYSNATEWSINANEKIYKGLLNISKKSFIKFYEKDSGMNIFSFDSQNVRISGTEIVFTQKINLQHNKEYYIAFDSGVIRSIQGCNLENEEQSDPNFWTFKVEDCPKECLNNGTCIGPNLCGCSKGWSGEYCETPICNNSCQNNGSCVGPNLCKCEKGWNGLICEIPFCNFICENNGECKGPDVCECKAGWNGTKCEFPICRNICHNDGKCIKPDSCECSSGWYGSNCEKAICDQSCNHGNCTAPYKCTCEAGWSGEYCEIELKNC